MTETTTNNQERAIIYGADLTSGEREEFANIPDSVLDVEGFVKYKGIVYRLGEFETITSRNDPLYPWDGYLEESQDAGIVVRLCGNIEHVIMGHYQEPI